MRIGDEIIDVGRAHRAGKAEEIHLHRRQRVRAKIPGGAFRVAHQIDRDVDFHLAQLGRHIRIAHAHAVHAPVEGARQGTCIQERSPKRKNKTSHLEPRAVMLLDHIRYQGRNRIVANWAAT